VPKALELIAAENFDIVVSDLFIGKDSGLSLVDPVRAKDRLAVFLLVTGDGTMETAVEAVKKNVDEYMLKPIKPSELLPESENLSRQTKARERKRISYKAAAGSNMKLLELSKTDELTGLFNRRSLFEQIHAEMQRAKRQSTPLCLMMCDVDGFKKFNDANGHLEGDKVLKDIASR